MNLLIKISEPTTVDLSPFVGLNLSQINWGDGIITDDVSIHTYLSSGQYIISAGAENFIEISDDFSIDNLEKFIILDNVSLNVTKIGSNFLKDCDTIKSLDLSMFTECKTIGSNFLENTTSIESLRLPYKPTLAIGDSIILASWGTDALAENCTILCGLYSDYYTNADVWKSKASLMNSQTHHFNYNINNRRYMLGETLYLINGEAISLDLYPEIKNAIFKYVLTTDTSIDIYKTYYTRTGSEGSYTYIPVENPIIEDIGEYYELDSDLIPEEDLPEKVDSETKYVYHSEKDIKKTFFVYRFKHKFYNGELLADEFYTNRYFKALKIENNLLYVDPYYKNNTSFYLEGEEENIDTTAKYQAVDLLDIADEAKSNYIETYITKINDWKNYDEPNYARGYLRFGIIDENNITEFDYEGDQITGFKLKIYANGNCRYFKLYSNLLNDSYEYPFIYINTDHLDQQKIIKGDYIEICTIKGKKYAKLYRDGEEYNILKAIDISSTWLQIVNGTNQFFCWSDPNYGSVLNLHVELVYNDLYEGI